MTLALPMIAEWTHHLVYDETATAQYKSGKRDVGNYGGRWLGNRPGDFP
jgi:hypothetical protein